MKIFIGADHRGFKLKHKITQMLTSQGYRVVDVGSHTDSTPSDYPKISYEVGKKVACSKEARGILVCMTGIGHAIAANKIPGAYAALCYNKRAARLSREHNNSNILVIGAKFVEKKDLLAIVKIWLKTPFAGGRHLRRVKQIREIEKGFNKPRYKKQ